MDPIRLHNDDWGYESNCFVCEQRNERGLQIPFFHDVDHSAVTATFQLDDHYSGVPTMIHGGVILAVLDEAMAWACIAVARRWAVTTETSTHFERPVRVGVPYDVIADIESVDDVTIRARARVTDERGRVRARAEATFTVVGEAQANHLAGREIDRLPEIPDTAHLVEQT